MSNKIEFVSIINNDYYIGFKATLKSLIVNNKQFNYKYNLFLVNELTEAEKQGLINIYKNINFINFNDIQYNFNNLDNTFREWNYNLFNRFEILKLKADKVIYLDADLLILNNIDNLINANVIFGAVQAPECSRIDHTQKKFFDSGVMVFDKELLNEIIYNNLIKLAKSKKWSGDEPVFNEYLANITKFLDKKYNVLTTEFSNYSLKDISVLQYVGSKKPWHSFDYLKNFDEIILKNNGIVKCKKLQTLFDSYL